MKVTLAAVIVAAGALLATGCATKKYVRDTESPIQAKAEQASQQGTQNTQQIKATQDQLKDLDDKTANGIDRANERAGAAEHDAVEAGNHANDAAKQATIATQKSDQNTAALGSLRDSVASLDDYQVQTTATVMFGINRDRLTAEAQAKLDQLAQDIQGNKRFFVAVEGFTDRTGPREYNEELSRRRADAVVAYLVSKHDVPVYRIQVVGLGPDKPLDEAHTAAARAKNRRVEVRVFTAPTVAASGAPTGNSAALPSAK
ncbi:MAG: OmpA family protein [Bryobacteraceae bacterium]|jgi:outer membrane protein OmpA-like peptidoglycan-associated protein